MVIFNDKTARFQHLTLIPHAFLQMLPFLYDKEGGICNNAYSEVLETRCPIIES